MTGRAKMLGKKFDKLTPVKVLKENLYYLENTPYNEYSKLDK